MKDKKMIRKMINDKNPEVGASFKPYAIKNVSIKLSVLVIILLVSFILLSDVNKLAFISPLVFFIILIFSSLLLGFFLACFLKKSLSLVTRLKLYSIYDTASFCLLAINIILFIILFIFVPTEVSGSSMESSYYNKDKLLVWHIGYSPKRDDAVIIDINDHYKYLFNEETFFIKRVVAQEGDLVSYTNGVFYVNNTAVSRTVSQQQFEKMTSYQSNSVLEDGTLKKGYSIVMGDNRHNSIDSRFIGAINNNDIEGKVIFRYYSKKGNFGIPKKYINE